MEFLGTILIVIVLTLVSGWADSQGFIHASRIWQNDLVVWNEVVRSAMGFAFGIVAYWFAVRYVVQLGVVSAEVQTLGWFSATIVGLALASGEIFRWTSLDKGVAIVVILGVAWLMFRTG